MRFRSALNLLAVALVAFSLTSAVPCVRAADGVDAQPADEQTELDIPVDDSVRICIDSLLPSSLIDRLAQPCNVLVKGAGIAAADIYAVPVDSPYGGFTLARPRFLARAATRRSDGLSGRWDSVESYRYLKVFAVVRKRDRVVRSRTVDVCMFGPRYQAPAAP